MMSFLTSLFDSHGRTLKRYAQVVDVINAHEAKWQKLSDRALQEKAAEFRSRLKKGESLEALLPEAFATVREASRRTLGLRHHDVQLIAGITFHEGKVAEQRTGEGKTLSATTALYLNALEEKGAHLVTVNDYLAQVGAGWMGPLYHALGMSVSVIGHDVSYRFDPEFTGETRGDERLEHFRPISRQDAYRADITYGTNNEFGFDYLRDNMAQRLADVTQRDHHFAIVDEADSILIDEARTPLIISAPDTEPTSKYVQFAQLVRQLQTKTDYTVDEKMKTAVLTDLGVKRLERLLGIKNLYEEDFDVIHHVEQALKAATVYQRDVDYVVREDQVIIVDEHTGRLMEGRRYSDGLHQAIEAKENVKVQQESRTLATISLQNYFRLYTKLSGMSGTSVTEAEEFQKIYDMDVIVVPTHKHVIRQDHPDYVYKTTRAKYAAILREVEEVHATGRPILLGTRSIDQNQVIAKMLQRNKVPHEVLNAKNHEREAFIIAGAGRPGAITVATNIAGRGVDIVLGGAQPERRAFETQKAFDLAMREWQNEHDAVVKSGGLHIVGTSRHEARRIDNQLRGRAGRQGDPGSSRFFVSLEDEIMRLFGGEQIQRLMTALQIDENMPIEHGLITKAITQAQIKVEGFFFDQRKNLVEYDDVMNRQRSVIYTRRRKLLEGLDAAEKDDHTNSELHDRATQAFTDHFTELLSIHAEDGFSESELEHITSELAGIIPFDQASLTRIREQLSALTTNHEKLELLHTIWNDTYKLRQDSLGKQTMREIELFVYLTTIDEQWMDHLDAMTNLRDGIWLRGGKEQALSEYKKEAFQLFEGMVQRVERESLRRLFRIQVRPAPQNDLLKNAQEVGTSEAAPELTAVTPTGELNPLAAAMAGAQPGKPGVRAVPVPQKVKAKAKKKGKSKGRYL